MKLAIISGKGGTGKSTISAAFLSLSKSTLAVDCDVDASNLYLIFNPIIDKQEVYISGEHALIDPSRCVRCGKCMTKCNFDAISKVSSDDDSYEWNYVVDEHSCEGCRHCFRVCPSGAIRMIKSDKSRIYTGRYRFGHMLFGRLAPGEENSGKLIDKLKTRADELLEEFALENMILDGPPGIACPVLATLNGVDKVVLVTEPSLSGFSDLQRVSELAKNFSKNIYVIINKYDLDEENSEMISSWVKENGMNLLGMLPFDKKMTQSMVQGRTIIEAWPESECASRLKSMFLLLSVTP